VVEIVLVVAAGGVVVVVCSGCCEELFVAWDRCVVGIGGGGRFVDGGEVSGSEGFFELFS